MIVKIFMVTITVSTLDCLPDAKCNRIKIGENWYDREILWSHFGRPYSLYIHKSSNGLFFSYSSSETYSDVDFQLAYYDINTRDYQTIAGIRDGCSVAIDQANDEIYLGGTDGIYKYNMLTRLADFYKEKGKNVWTLFYRRNLFYISYPEQKLHIEMDGRFAVVKEFENIEIDHFHVATNDDIYYANKSGLFMYDKKNMQTEVINELLTVRQIVEDNDGDLYICTNFGVFVDVKFEGLKKILDFKNVHGLAFDKDNNFIYSDETSIVRLLYSVAGCAEKDNLW